MSFGGLGNCPLCWNDPEDCHCDEKVVATFYAECERKRKEMEELNKAKYKDPMWEEWEKYKEKYE